MKNSLYLSLILLILVNYTQAQWTTSGSNIYYSGGNVGIGTSSPSQELMVNGNISGKNQNAAYSNLYRFGGIYFTWDSDQYGTNSHHSIRSTYGNTYGDELTINSFNHLRLNIDANNNDTNSYFEIGHHTDHTQNILFRLVSPSGNVGIGSSNPTAKLQIGGNASDWGTSIQGQTVGTLHFDPQNTTNHYGNAITFGASDYGNGEDAQAGIYVRSDGSYGTKMYFSTTNSYVQGAKTAMMIDQGGNVGLGTVSPSEKLDITNGSIYGYNSIDAFLKIKRKTGQPSIKGIYDGTSGYDGHVIIEAGRTSDAIYLNNYISSNVYMVQGGGKVGVGTTSPSQKLDVNGSIAVKGQAAISCTSNDIQVGDLASGDGVRGLILRAGDQDRLKINTNGNVGIGTTTPDEKLTVKGKIHAEEVKVDLSVPGPDYVFADNYELTTLEEIEAFIKSNKHLPEIPSAKEMEANGVELGTMNMLLLQKIEELTLYVIDLQKEITELKSK